MGRAMGWAGRWAGLGWKNAPGPPDLGFLGQPPLRGFLEKNRLTLPCEIFREKSATLPT